MIQLTKHMISVLYLKSTNLSAYLIRTSGVPLSHHHSKNVEKTKGLHVPLAYPHSTTIFLNDLAELYYLTLYLSDYIINM